MQEEETDNVYLFSVCIGDVRIKQWYSNRDGGEQGWNLEHPKTISDKLLKDSNLLLLQNRSKSTKIPNKPAILKSKSFTVPFLFSFSSAIVSDKLKARINLYFR